MATSKRGQNEGTIFHRADGRWAAMLTVEATGKRKSYYGKTRQEVARKLAEALRDQAKGLPVVGERLTVAAYLADWLTTIKAQRKPKTYHGYESIMRLHVVPTLGKVALAKLTPQHLKVLYAAKLEEGRAQTTVHHMHAAIHRALEEAFRLGLVQRNVADMVTPPQIKTQDMHPLTGEQAQTLLRAAEGNRLHALYVLALTTGMREGELMGLRWQDVELDASTGAAVQVRNTMQRSPSRGGAYLDTPKTASSRRRLPLNSTAVAALRAHRAHQLEERLQAGPAWKDQQLVFCTKVGTPLASGTVLRNGLYPLLEGAHLPRIRFHDLRHTAATLMLLKGLPINVVAQRLGHSKPSVTVDIYGHVLGAMQTQMLAALDELFTLPPVAEAGL